MFLMERKTSVSEQKFLSYLSSIFDYSLKLCSIITIYSIILFTHMSVILSNYIITKQSIDFIFLIDSYNSHSSEY